MRDTIALSTLIVMAIFVVLVALWTLGNLIASRIEAHRVKRATRRLRVATGLMLATQHPRPGGRKHPVDWHGRELERFM
jgi:uncharacterized membrane protein YdbT with pleckstrin-like domain